MPFDSTMPPTPSRKRRQRARYVLPPDVMKIDRVQHVVMFVTVETRPGFVTSFPCDARMVNGIWETRDPNRPLPREWFPAGPAIEDVVKAVMALPDTHQNLHEERAEC